MTAKKTKRIVKRCGNCGWTLAKPFGQHFPHDCNAPVPLAFAYHGKKGVVWHDDGKGCPCWKERAK